jgi:hypothetical protein
MIAVVAQGIFPGDSINSAAMELSPASSGFKLKSCMKRAPSPSNSKAGKTGSNQAASVEKSGACRNRRLQAECVSAGLTL